MTVRNFKNQKGFTVVETLIAVMLSAGVILVAGSVLYTVGKTSLFVNYSADEEANARSLEYILPIYLEQFLRRWICHFVRRRCGRNR